MYADKYVNNISLNSRMYRCIWKISQKISFVLLHDAIYINKTLSQVRLAHKKRRQRRRRREDQVVVGFCFLTSSSSPHLLSRVWVYSKKTKSRLSCVTTRNQFLIIIFLSQCDDDVTEAHTNSMTIEWHEKHCQRVVEFFSFVDEVWRVTWMTTSISAMCKKRIKVPKRESRGIASFAQLCSQVELVRRDQKHFSHCLIFDNSEWYRQRYQFFLFKGFLFLLVMHTWEAASIGLRNDKNVTFSEKKRMKQRRSDRNGSKCVKDIFSLVVPQWRLECRVKFYRVNWKKTQEREPKKIDFIA